MRCKLNSLYPVAANSALHALYGLALHLTYALLHVPKDEEKKRAALGASKSVNQRVMAKKFHEITWHR
jgi:hypothetical protein